MKKRLSAILLAMVFVLSAMPITQAETEKPYAITVPTDIMVNIGNGYVNGPATIETDDVATDAKAAFKANIGVGIVKVGMQAWKDFAMIDKGVSESDIDNAIVDGYFTIKIDYSNSENSTTGEIDIPDTIVTKEAMTAAFEPNEDFKKIFEVTEVKDENDVITVKVEVVGGGVNYTTLDTYLKDLTLTCEGIKFSDYGNYSILGEVTGETTLSYDGNLADVAYTFTQKANDGANKYVDPENTDKISGTVVVSRPIIREDDTPVSSDTTKEIHTVTIDLDGYLDNIQVKHKEGTKLTADDFVIPEREGYKAVLYLDEEFTQPLDETIEVEEDFHIYVKWLPDGSIPVLESDDHFAYVIGYPTKDGSEIVKPENNITREEIATIFYRLLKDDVRDVIFSSTNTFDDVAKERWSNKAISTMANGEYITGYPDGSFKPAKAITRAEFVTVAARFFAGDTIENSKIADFTDTADHWAAEYIRRAAASNWIDGYSDGTFKPEKFITRAEVMKIINNMLNRHVAEEGLVENAKRWDDNDPNAWYYYEVIEATNPHNYDRAEGEIYESWTEIVENKVWIEKSEYEDAE